MFVAAKRENQFTVSLGFVEGGRWKFFPPLSVVLASWLLATRAAKNLKDFEKTLGPFLRDSQIRRAMENLNLTHTSIIFSN